MSEWVDGGVSNQEKPRAPGVWDTAPDHTHSSSSPATKSLKGDSPAGPVPKNVPCGAGDVGSTRGQGTNTPQALEQLSPRAASTETYTSQRARMPRGKIPHYTAEIPRPQLRPDAVK